MEFSSFAMLEAFVLTFALSIDAFVASFAYGSNKIKIPALSVQIINIICNSVLGLSLLAGSFIRQYIPNQVTISVCFVIMFLLGILNLLDSVTKSVIKKYAGLKKELTFSMFNFKFILQLYADPKKADVDYSGVISPKEAVSLAIALSLDGLAVGFGAAVGNVNGLAVFLCSFIINPLAVYMGCYSGNKIARKLSFNISWLSGILLLALAFFKLI